MEEREGVIKYQLNHQNTPIDTAMSITELTAWRSVLFNLSLIGKIKGRYNGLGFGNISQRVSSNTQQFLITGSQTGGIETLKRQHYCLIATACPYQNTIDSKGEIEPSSESLTHASIYQHSQYVQFVIHIHCPEIWQMTKQLNLPHTAAHIPYGTTEMAHAVSHLLDAKELQEKKIFSMLGHQDGIVAFSHSIENAAQTLISYYAQSLALAQI